MKLFKNGLALFICECKTLKFRLGDWQQVTAWCNYPMRRSCIVNSQLLKDTGQCCPSLYLQLS